MSWTQNYSVPAIETLLMQLTGKSIRQLLEAELNAQGITIVKTEPDQIDGMYGDVEGIRVFLSDGRVFEPKLVRVETADGNWGNDVYEYRLKDEQVEVEHVDLSEPYEDPYFGGVDNCCLGDNCNDSEGC